MARPAYREAIAQLENAVRLCREMGGDRRWCRREQGLHLKLGQALIANQGYQAAVNAADLRDALRPADEMGDASLQLPALFGLWAGHHIAGTGSEGLARRFAALAETQSETGPRLVGLRMLGLERFYAGRFTESLALMGRRWRATTGRAPRLTRRFGHDPRAGAANYKAWNLWYLGFPDQAAATPRTISPWTGGSTTRTRRASHCARSHPHLAAPAGPGRGRRAGGAAPGRRMTLPCGTRGPRFTSAGPCRSKARRPACDEIEAGLHEARGDAAPAWVEPFHLGLAAEAYALARAGATSLGEASPNAFAALAPGHHRAFAADLYPLSGAASAGRRGRAAARPRRTCAKAPWRSQAKAESPSLWSAPRRDQASPGYGLAGGRGGGRVTLLAPVYGRFSEGFRGTGPAVKAKELLDELP